MPAVILIIYPYNNIYPLFLQASEITDQSCKDALEAALQRVSELEEDLKLKEDIIKELEKNKNNVL